LLCYGFCLACPRAILLKGKRLLPTSRCRPRHALTDLALVAACLCAALSAAAEQPSWRDLESRIQYGYYTEDVSALRHLSETVNAGGGEDKLTGYYAGLLDWRLAQLSAPAGAAGADAAAHLAQRCVSDVDRALALQADFAEALALRSACLSTPMASGASHAPFAARRARKDIARALQLDAHNPRVLLLDAMADYELASDQGGNKERALSKLRQTVAAFEAERRGSDQLPGWGAAEAWVLLARDLLDHGDPVGSRDALEHALLIAPQFAQAHRLLNKITAG
jgi:hypothetical protein